MRTLIGAVLLCAVVSVGPAARAPEAPVVRPNDNRTPAGVPRGDTLFLRLVVTRARWYPQADSGPAITVNAVGEEGKPPQIPAPLIRVRAGTYIFASVRNALADSNITVTGLQTRPATARDSVRITPGATRTFRFTAGAPGTYTYTMLTGPLNPQAYERETTGGAFVVDSPGARVDDRIFVINIWGDSASGSYRNALTINGRSWPYTERLDLTLGDTMRARLVNASGRDHPMHLHGFYFRVDSRDDGLNDSTYMPSQRRLVVTEEMHPGSTMRMAWYADRPGNWLFHCHIAFHVIPDAALLDPPAPDATHSGDASVHMAGLILGINVRPNASWVAPERRDPQSMRLLVQEGKRRGRSERALGYVLQTGAEPPARDSVQSAGPVLVMTRGRPTDVTVVNHLQEPTGVHWHGVELESYSDGVVGWSGAPGRVAPPIAPNDSFVAHLTLPRAGTFIYHTHLGDLIQLTSGLYGAIVVLEPGQTFDPATDHVYVTGWDGTDDPPSILVNGDSVLPPVVFAAGKTHRLRFVNIGPAVPLRVTLARDTSLVRWRIVAKDGADYPPGRVAAGRADVEMDIGEVYDAEFDAREPGEYVLTIATPAPPPHDSVRRQRIIVR